MGPSVKRMNLEGLWRAGGRTSLAGWGGCGTCACWHRTHHRCGEVGQCQCGRSPTPKAAGGLGHTPHSCMVLCGRQGHPLRLAGLVGAVDTQPMGLQSELTCPYPGSTAKLRKWRWCWILHRLQRERGETHRCGTDVGHRRQVGAGGGE